MVGKLNGFKNKKNRQTCIGKSICFIRLDYNRLVFHQFRHSFFNVFDSWENGGVHRAAKKSNADKRQAQAASLQ